MILPVPGMFFTSFQVKDPCSIFNTLLSSVTAMKNRGARFLGISAANGSRNGADPYEDMAYLADQSQSYVQIGRAHV